MSCPRRAIQAAPDHGSSCFHCSTRSSTVEGVLELREDIGPGYRVYLGRYGAAMVILLCGGDKRSQDADIERAKEYWLDWKRRNT